GRASMIRAVKAENIEILKNNLERSIKFFENSSKKLDYFQLADFSLPLSRLIYTILFKREEKQKAEVDVQRHLEEAKNAAIGSESKEKLLESIKSTLHILKELDKLEEIDLNTMKSDLGTILQYCKDTEERLITAHEKEPHDAELIKKAISIIKDVISKMQESSPELSEKAKNISKQVNKIDENVLEKNDATSLEIQIQLFDNVLKDLYNILSEKQQKGVAVYYRMVIKAKDIGAKIFPLTIFVSKITSEFERIIKDEPPKEPTPEIPYLTDLESVIYGIFTSVYQKERKAGVSEANSRTLILLRGKLLELTALGEEICWLDVGCGDGRSLEVLDMIEKHGEIKYYGIDNMHEHRDEAEKRAKRYKLKSSCIVRTDAASMEFNSKFDLVSAVLLLHEVDPLCLPYVMRNMLRALKDDGTLVISDFEGPYAQEKNVVAWYAKDIEEILKNIGANQIGCMQQEANKYPKERGFYGMYVKKPKLSYERFNGFLTSYGKCLNKKNSSSRKKRVELGKEIENRVCKILGRSDIDRNNISKEEWARIHSEIEEEYGIKANKIKQLTEEIVFLDDRIEKFENSIRCNQQ
ncbi:MAG: class I SAM-dependent methyltransferase, partial [Nitrospirota bacterium]|nr:class I SAM-dependent methyltransferase [Nitrospirota bacterium]